MYTYVRALAVSKDLGSRWQEVDISNMLMYDIFTKYRKVYAVLSNPYLDNPVAVDLDTIRAEFSSSEDSFSDFLILINNRTLEALPSIPNLTPKYAKFTDAFRAGYKLQAQNIYTSGSSSQPASYKTSLRVNRDTPPTDMDMFYKHCMVSINGFFHRTDGDGTYAYVLDAMNSLFKSRQNQIGFLSFKDIGQIEQVPIDLSMVYAQANDSNLKRRAYIKLNKDITNKTVLLVLGGYLLFPDGHSFWQTGDDIFAIDFNAMPLVERYFESLPYLDLKDLGLPVSTDNPSLINLEQFYSDTVLKKYLTLSQSFFVVIDTPEVFTNKIYIRPSKLPGMFTAYKEPTELLLVGNGRVAEYWKTYEDGHWAVNVHDSYLHNKVLSTRPIDQLVNVSDSDVPLRTYYDSRGWLLEIGKDF